MTVESKRGSTDGNIDNGVTKKILQLHEGGRNLHLHCYANSSNMRFKIVCDKVVLMISSADYWCTANLHPWGYDVNTENIQVLDYNAASGTDNVFAITIPFKWDRSLLISVTNASGGVRSARVSIIYEPERPVFDVQEPEAVKDPKM